MDQAAVNERNRAANRAAEQAGTTGLQDAPDTPAAEFCEAPGALASSGSLPVITSDEPAIEDAGSVQLPFPLVAIGISAADTGPVVELLHALPSDTGMAFVVLSESGPDGHSALSETLAKSSGMSVIAIHSGMQPQPDTIHLQPPDVCLSLTDGTFQLESQPGDSRASRPIDFFFRSLAADQKNNAVAILLSNSGPDAASGFTAIKGEGGITILGRSESAHLPGSRGDLHAGQSDLVLTPSEIGRHLVKLAHRLSDTELRRLRAGQPLAENERHILQLMRDQSGIGFHEYKLGTLRRRLARRMMLARCTSVTDYIGLLQTNAAEVAALVQESLIGLTHFFRDPDAFDALRTSVFPVLIDGRPLGQPIRIWSAGCSSGEEAYSLAIALLEALPGGAPEPAIQVFGTDASAQNIALARAGIYPETIEQDVSPERLNRFFVRAPNGYQVAKQVRDVCIFAHQNLSSDPPFSRIDLVSCRNVLIYFDAPLQRRVLHKFHYALRPQGYLVLGASEGISEFGSQFSPIDRKHRIFAKSPLSSATALTARNIGMLAPQSASGTYRPALEEWPDYELQRAADRIVLGRYGPPGVVIGEDLQILQTRGQTSAFLQLSPGIASLDLIRMVHPSLAKPLRDAAVRAFEFNEPVTLDNIPLPGETSYIAVRIQVLPIPGAAPRSRCALVLFEQLGPAGNENETLPPAPVYELVPPDLRHVGRLQQELESTRFYLQAMIEQRDAKNQELETANEEIQSVNEELHSHNAELEALQEELQSSNEELQTLNDELEERNKTVSRTANDLSNLLGSVNIPVLMLDSALRVRQFTPSIQKLLNLRSSDIGRPLNEIRLHLPLGVLEPILEEVLEKLTTRESEVQDDTGRWHLLRVRPYRTSDNRIEGVVAIFIDIDQLRRIQADLRDARDFADAVFDNVPISVAVLNEDLRIARVNGAFCALTRREREDLVGRFFPEEAMAFWGLEPLQAELERCLNGEQAAFQLEWTSTSRARPQVLCLNGAVLNSTGQRVILLTLEDITARSLSAAEMADQYEELTEQVQSAAVALDRSQEELRDLAAHLITAQEEERQRVARELHDDINQRLALYDLDLRRLEEVIPEDFSIARAHIQNLRVQSQSLSEEVRAISHRLHPAILDDLGLVAAIKALLDDFGARERMPVTFRPFNVPECIPRATAGALYRIAQEGLRNVSKHAGRTHVKMSLEGEGNTLRMEISDAGEGFDPDSVRRGLGFVSMAERARLARGHIRFESSLGKGTMVIVEMPLEAEEQRQ